MRYALPIALVALLVTLWTVSPHLEPQRLRTRARRVGEDLRAKHGFREGSKASWSETRSSGWPPFHYGKHRRIENEQIGTLHGKPVRVAGYEVVTTGSRHLYGLAVVVLPRPVEWMEVRGERPFSAARVQEHIPDGQLRLGDPEFDKSWTAYADSAEALLLPGTRQLVDTMLAAPTHFSWRTHESELLLWKRDGWSSAVQLLTSVSGVMNLLGLAELDPADV